MCTNCQPAAVVRWRISEAIIRRRAWSPDGRELAVALSRDGLTQIYRINADGSGLKRFTQSYGIDTEPVYSKDGRWIYFTSDRGGTPQIYRQPVAGGAAERVTFGSSYAISPDISPDGMRMAYISRIDAEYRLAVMDSVDGAGHAGYEYQS